MNLRQASHLSGSICPTRCTATSATGLVPAFKLGNRWKLRKSVLDRWMERKMSQIAEEAPVAETGGNERRGSYERGPDVWWVQTKATRRTRHRFELDQGGGAEGFASQGYELVSFGLEPLAQDTVVDGAIMDAPLVAAAISNDLRATRRSRRERGDGRLGAFGNRQARVTPPLMTEDELYDRIQSEASQHIPFDIADVNLELPAPGLARFADGRAAGGGEEGQNSEPHKRAGAGGQDAGGGGYRRASRCRTASR